MKMHEVFPKFIIEGDSLVIGNVTFHKQLVNNEKDVKGGGGWRRDGQSFIFYGASYDYGAADFKDIKMCVQSGNVYTNKSKFFSMAGDYDFYYDNGADIIHLNPQIPTNGK